MLEIWPKKKVEGEELGPGMFRDLLPAFLSSFGIDFFSCTGQRRLEDFTFFTSNNIDCSSQLGGHLL